MDILTDRLIDHGEAREAMQRLVNSHFNNDRAKCEHARMSIPANPDRDDDLVLSAYIKQRRQTSDDLQRILDAVLFIFGPEGLLKVDKHVKMERRAQETNDEIDALQKQFASELATPI